MKALILTLVLLGSAAAQEKVVGGPFAVRVTGRSATLGWLVQNGSVDIAGRAIPVLEARKTSLSGLQPGQTYHYTAFPAGVGSFKTAPGHEASFEFVVFGDTRTRHDLHRRIIAAISPLNPDFLLHTGDLVTDGYDMEQWPRFFEIEGSLLRKTAFYPVLGNHERNNRLFHQLFDVETPYNSFDWGSAHFTLINTDLGNVALSPEAKENFWREQTRWMEADLAKAANMTFRFVIMHHPPLTAVKSRQGGNKEVAALMPLFEQYKVTAAFTGHDHNYQRHEKNGVSYIITGGGGAPLYAVDAPIDGVTKKVESTEHFVRIKVTPGKAVAEAIALAGHSIESVTWIGDKIQVPPAQTK